MEGFLTIRDSDIEQPLHSLRVFLLGLQEPQLLRKLQDDASPTQNPGDLKPPNL